MTLPPVSPNPLGPDAPERDYVPLAFNGMIYAILAGTGIISALLWAVRSLQVGAPPTEIPDLGSPAAILLLIGTPAGMLVAATLTWRVLAPVGSTYRQGGLAMVSAFATLVVSLTAAPVDMAFGRMGLVVLSACCGLLAWLFWRRAERARETA
jgi:hypothetical protein